MNGKQNNSLCPLIFSEDFLFGADDSFSIKIGGTIYDVTTHFNPEGKQTVLQQFMALLQEQEPLHI